MTSVRVRLQWTLAQLEAATNHLEIALQDAKSRHYTQTWREAIAKALTDTEITRLHIGNILTCIARRDESPLPALEQKED